MRHFPAALFVLAVLSSVSAVADEPRPAASTCEQRIAEAYQLLRDAEASPDAQVEACAPAADKTKTTKALLDTLDQQGKAFTLDWTRYQALQPQLRKVGTPETQSGSICQAPDDAKQLVNRLGGEIHDVHKGLEEREQALDFLPDDFQKQYGGSRWGSFFRQTPANCRNTKKSIATVQAKLVEMAQTCRSQVERGPAEAYSALYGLGYAISHGCKDGGCTAVNVGGDRYEVDNVDMYDRWHKEISGDFSRDEAQDYIDRHCEKEWSSE